MVKSVPQPSTGMIYDAFISYKHGDDKAIASGLQTILQTLGKPWWRRRVMRIFRDDTTLTPSHELWPSIERALEHSRNFILIASPEAAASRWVAKEVEFWLAHRDVTTLYVAVTAGDLAWDSAAGDFKWDGNTPLPSVLKGRFINEPLWIDLRGYRGKSKQLGKGDEHFTSAGAGIAASILGRAKEDLLSDELGQQRRNLAWAWGAATVSASAAALAIWFGVQAIRQAEIVREERNRAAQQRDAALLRESELLSGLADQEVEKGNAIEAALIAIEALQDATSTNQFAKTRPVSAKAEVSLNAALSPGLVRTLKGHFDGVTSVAFSSDGSLVMSAASFIAKFWDMRTGKAKRILIHGSSHISSVAVSPDKTLGLSGSYDRTLKLWYTSTGNEACTLTGHDNAITSVAFSPDGRLIASGDKGGILKLWNVSTCKEVRNTRTYSVSVESVSFSFNGEQVLSGSMSGELTLWSVSSGEKIRSMDHQAAINSVYFSLRQSLAISGGIDGTVKLWNTVTGETLHTLQQHTNSVKSVALSHDASLALTGSADESIKLWNVATGQLIRTFAGHTETVTSVSFSPDGTNVLSGSEDRTLKLWDLRSWESATGQSLVDRAKLRVTRCLTPDQRKQYFLPREVPDWCYAMKKWPYQNGRDAPPDIAADK